MKFRVPIQTLVTLDGHVCIPAAKSVQGVCFLTILVVLSHLSTALSGFAKIVLGFRVLGFGFRVDVFNFSSLALSPGTCG